MRTVFGEEKAMPSQRVMEVMVVSDDLGVQQMLAKAVGRCGRAPIIASAIQEAEAILNRESIALIFCSDELPNGGVEEFIGRASRPPSLIPVVLVSRLDDWSRYLHFLQVGAFDYVLCPSNGDEIDRLTRAVLFGGEVQEPKDATAVV
jgi:DNA-binding response OmpR family regulator